MAYFDDLHIRGESGMFVGEKPVSLMFPPSRILRVYNSILGANYVEGKDWSLNPESNTIGLTEHSAIPKLAAEELYPRRNVCYYPAPGANAVPGGPDGKNLRFDAALFFAEHQIEVDYIPAKIDWPEDIFEPSPFFHEDVPIRRIVTLGDSITEGYNASACIGKAPFSPSYPDWIAKALGAELINLGRNGASCRYLREIEIPVIEAKPDLISIAFGMNDLTSMSAEEYTAEILRAVEIFRAKLPRVQIMVISPMSGNPEWNHTPLEKTRMFAEQLKRLAAREKLIFADVFRTWSFAIMRKGFFALTGNGVNHPNDFGHSLYARTILAALHQR